MRVSTAVRPNSGAYRLMGRGKVWSAFREAHCQRLEQWVDHETGRYVGDEGEHDKLNKRMLFGQCVSLLDSGEPARVQLANRIITQTHSEKNTFIPVRCATLLMQFGDKLSDEASAHLRGICEQWLIEVIERRQAAAHNNNFTAMNTFFLLAMGQVLDGYEFDHTFAGVRELYTADRLKEIGRNAIQSMTLRSERCEVLDEFNSPTYTPITLASLAHIVELIDDPYAQELALEVEMKLWREVLAQYHPGLNLSCAPYSRGYRQDMLGQITHMRLLLANLGLSKDRSLIELLDTDDDPMIVHQQKGSHLHRWHVAAVECSPHFHVPKDALEELRHRRQPKRFEANIQWERNGWIDPRTEQFIPLQGGAIPGGEARLTQVQHEDWCFGFRSYVNRGHSFPIHLHYALSRHVTDFREVRTLTGAVFFHRRWPEWDEDLWGRRMEPRDLNNFGHVWVTERSERCLEFRAQGLTELQAVPTEESSFNSLIPVHFDPQPRVSVNGQTFEGEPIELRDEKAVCHVEDGGFVYEIEYCFEAPVTVRLWRWANFIRFGAVFYEGASRKLATEELESFQVRGSLRILDTP